MWGIELKRKYRAGKTENNNCVSAICFLFFFWYRVIFVIRYRRRRRWRLPSSRRHHISSIIVMKFCSCCCCCCVCLQAWITKNKTNKVFLNENLNYKWNILVKRQSCQQANQNWFIFVIGRGSKEEGGKISLLKTSRMKKLHFPFFRKSIVGYTLRSVHLRMKILFFMNTIPLQSI